VAELSTTGKLRAAINFGNPILANRGPGGEPVGVSVDLAREAAKRLGVPVDLVTFTSAGNVVEAIKARTVDMAFVAIDPVRAADMEYTAPYVIIEGAYLVRNNVAPAKERGRGPPRHPRGRGPRQRIRPVPHPRAEGRQDRARAHLTRRGGLFSWRRTWRWPQA
jgi:hypothetical protein